MPKIALHRLSKDTLIRMATHRCCHRHTFLEHPDCWTEEQERVGFFDIETSNLDADYGIVLTYAIKVEGKDEILCGVIDIKDIKTAEHGNEDRHVVRACLDDLKQFDKIITYYGKRFDVPFLRVRALWHSSNIAFPFYGTIKHLDVYDMARHRLKLSSRRQENVCRVLFGETNKTRVPGDIWRAAARGDKSALDYVLEHNRGDVIDLERIYHKLINFTRRNDTSI